MTAIRLVVRILVGLEASLLLPQVGCSCSSSSACQVRPAPLTAESLGEAGLWTREGC